MRGLPTSSSILFSRLLSLSRRIPEHGFTSHSNPWIGVRCFSSGVSGSSSDRRRGPLVQYRSMVSEGKLKHDIYQEKVALELEELLGKLQNYEKEMEDYHVKLANWKKSRENERRKLLLEEADHKQQGGVWIDTRNHRKSFIGKWISRRRHQNVEPGVGKMVSYLNREKKLDSLVGIKPVPPPSPKGIYLYGNVGSGKTMLMDMFYSATEGTVKHRRRFHFHEAMLEIHEHMHEVWKNQTVDQSQQPTVFSWIDGLPFSEKVKEWLIGEERYRQEVHTKHILSAVADKFLIDRKTDETGASILCFDEIQTVDVFAIIALSGILSKLLSTGTVLVATSNRAPEELNQDGMQKDIFLSFLLKLEESCQKILVGSDIDYRRLIPNKRMDQVYFFWPSNSDSCREYEETWHKITGKAGGRIFSTIIPVMFGRFLEVPESCNGIARFDFEYICGRPVGAADYIAVARHYHTVFISNIPVMSMRIRDKARRFITLIDELYNHHCLTFCLADSSIDDLFQGTDEGTLFDLESFQFETEIEGGKLRRDVLAEGSVGSGASPSGIVSLLSSQEEMFAFRRAVSRLIEMQTPLYREGVKAFHLLFQQRHNNRLTRSAPVSYNPSL
ncbi:AFG1-like ATPase isoform X1 [Zingiber officinale]|uniref:AFG1-like ATPase isoform X1 n=1 Tax=Zingiber officinale TaxID=94328 RepID=UPI001C4AC41F|nr:AFG1-like ATPase isoform X1 [Zingiber officinale]